VYIKCTMLFQCVTQYGLTEQAKRIAGWSESYYTTPGSSMTQTISYFRTLMQNRARLLPEGAEIVGQRYQQVDPVGPSSTGAEVFPGAAGTAQDYPGLALFFRIPAVASRNISPLALRGVPDARIQRGEYWSSQTYDRAIADFLGRLNIASWHFKGRDLSQTAFPLINIQDNGTFTTEDNHTLNAGDMVRVLRTINEDGDQVGGRFKIIAPVTATSGTLLNYGLGETTKGAIRKDLVTFPIYGPMVNVVPRIVTRKVGRPFTGFRGRASKKR